MNKILGANGRIEQAEGLRFYEQDIVMLDYNYKGDLIVDVAFTYKYPGFGFIIAKQDASVTDITNSPDTYLLKVGINDFSVYNKKFSDQQRVVFTTCQFDTDEIKTRHLRLKKISGTLYVYDVNTITDKELLLGSLLMPLDFEEYYIGLYSNKNNIVNKMSVSDNRPQFWFANIQNTNGGRISFEQDCFKIENAEKAIEVEQEKISLPAGSYYFDYTKVPVNNKNDISVYIFDSTENKMYAKSKNLLDDKNMFTVSDKELINVLFRGKNGIIKNISIKENKEEDYVSTDGQENFKNGSSIKILLNNLKQIDWVGTINSVPENELIDNPLYSILSFGSFISTKEKLLIDLNTEYHFNLKKMDDKWLFTVYDSKQKAVSSFELKDKVDFAEVFKNLSGTITSLIVQLEDGSNVNIILQKTIKKYVPIAITSPIIVTDKNDNPFDLSSSYRVFDSGEYFFTNWERELFETKKNRLELSSKVDSIGSNVIIYGFNSDIVKSKLYNVKNEMDVNSISQAVKSYEIVPDEMYKIIDGYVIELDEAVLNKYRYYIVDYLKSDSYCVNITDDRQQYIVDISSSQEVIHTIYDIEENGQIVPYKTIDDLVPIDNKYIVVRKNNEVKE